MTDELVHDEFYRTSLDIEPVHENFDKPSLNYGRDIQRCRFMTKKWQSSQIVYIYDVF
jgi:hypothetical protein